MRKEPAPRFAPTNGRSSQIHPQQGEKCVGIEAVGQAAKLTRPSLQLIAKLIVRGSDSQDATGARTPPLATWVLLGGQTKFALLRG